jgi:hypothetical protein
MFLNSSSASRPKNDWKTDNSAGASSDHRREEAQAWMNSNGVALQIVNWFTQLNP